MMKTDPVRRAESIDDTPGAHEASRSTSRAHRRYFSLSRSTKIIEKAVQKVVPKKDPIIARTPTCDGQSNCEESNVIGYGKGEWSDLDARESEHVVGVVSVRSESERRGSRK